MNTITPAPARRLRTGLAVAALGLALLTGCGDDTTATDAAGTDSSATPAPAVTLEDGWVKSADEGMSAAFGTLTNPGEEDLTLVGVTTDASADVELHETVEGEDGEMMMQKIDGGFIIPAGGTHELAPGADHIMFLTLADPLEAGETVTLTLTFDDGSTTEVDAVVRDFDGGDEKYHGGDTDMGGDMSGDDAEDMG